MNREETMEAIKVMQAFVDKKRVRTAFGQELDPQGCCYPDWNWTKGLKEYVIAPDPIERWIAVYKIGSVVDYSISHFDSKEDCLKQCQEHVEFERAIKLVEVTE